MSANLYLDQSLFKGVGTLTSTNAGKSVGSQASPSAVSLNAGRSGSGSRGGDVVGTKPPSPSGESRQYRSETEDREDNPIPKVSSGGGTNTGNTTSLPKPPAPPKPPSPPKVTSATFKKALDAALLKTLGDSLTKAEGDPPAKPAPAAPQQLGLGLGGSGSAAAPKDIKPPSSAAAPKSPAPAVKPATPEPHHESAGSVGVIKDHPVHGDVHVHAQNGHFHFTGANGSAVHEPVPLDHSSVKPLESPSPVGASHKLEVPKALAHPNINPHMTLSPGFNVPHDQGGGHHETQVHLPGNGDEAHVNQISSALQTGRRVVVPKAGGTDHPLNQFITGEMQKDKPHALAEQVDHHPETKGLVFNPSGSAPTPQKQASDKYWEGVAGKAPEPEKGKAAEPLELTPSEAPAQKEGTKKEPVVPEKKAPPEQRGTEGTPLFDSADAPDVGPSDRERLLEEQAGGEPSSGEVEMLGAPPVDQRRSAPSGYINRMLRKQRRDDEAEGATSQSSVQDTPPGWDGKWADDEAAYQSRLADQSGAGAAPDTPKAEGAADASDARIDHTEHTALDLENHLRDRHGVEADQIKQVADALGMRDREPHSPDHPGIDDAGEHEDYRKLLAETINELPKKGSDEAHPEIDYKGGKYTGPVNADGLPHGEGKHVSPQGHTFEGTFENGSLKRGKLSHPNGASVEGDFQNNQPHGRHTATSPSGRSGTLEYDNGRVVGAFEGPPSRTALEGPPPQGALEGPPSQGALEGPPSRPALEGPGATPPIGEPPTGAGGAGEPPTPPTDAGGAGEPPTPPTDPQADLDNAKTPEEKSLQENLDDVLNHPNIPDDLKDVVRDLPGEDANWDAKFEYIKNVMKRLSEEREKGRKDDTDWYALGKALMALDPFDAIENWYGAFKKVLGGLNQAGGDAVADWKTKGKLKEAMGMKVPKDIRRKTKGILKEDAFGHGDVAGTAGKQKYWTKFQHEEFHKAHEDLKNSYEQDKAEAEERGQSTDAVDHTYKHLYDGLLRRNRILANAENGVYHAHTTPSPEDHEDFHRVLYNSIGDTSYENKEKLFSLINDSRGWSKEHLAEVTSMLGQKKDASPEDREAALETAIGKINDLEKTHTEARKIFNSFPGDLKRGEAPDREDYAGPAISDYLREKLEGEVADAEGMVPQAEEELQAAQEAEERANTTVEEAAQAAEAIEPEIVDADEDEDEAEDDIIDAEFTEQSPAAAASAPLGLPSPVAAEAAPPSWGSDLADPEEGEENSRHFRHDVKPTHNTGRGFVDHNGRHVFVQSVHEDPSGGEVKYVLKQVNPNFVSDAEETPTNQKYITKVVDAERLHELVNEGEYKPSRVPWAHGLDDDHHNDEYTKELQSIQGDNPIRKEELTREQKIKRGLHDEDDKHYGHGRLGPQMSGMAHGKYRGGWSNPSHNVGSGYKNKATGEEFFIKDHFFDKSGDKDFYKVEYLDDKGERLESKDVPVEDVMSRLFSGEYEGTRTPWHGDHTEDGKPDAGAVASLLENRKTGTQADVKEAARKEPESSPDDVSGGEAAEEASEVPEEKAGKASKDKKEGSVAAEEVVDEPSDDAVSPEVEDPAASEDVEEEAEVDTPEGDAEEAEVDTPEGDAEEAEVDTPEGDAEEAEEDVATGSDLSDHAKELKELYDGRMSGKYDDTYVRRRLTRHANKVDLNDENARAYIDVLGTRAGHDKSAQILSDRDKAAPKKVDSSSAKDVEEAEVDTPEVDAEEAEDIQHTDDSGPIDHDGGTFEGFHKNGVPYNGTLTYGDTRGILSGYFTKDGTLETGHLTETDGTRTYVANGEFVDKKTYAKKLLNHPGTEEVISRLAQQSEDDRGGTKLEGLDSLKESLDRDIGAEGAAPEEVDFSSGRIDLPEGKDTPDFEAIGRVGGAYREHGHDIKEEALEKLKALGVKDPEEAYNTVTSEVDDKAAKDAEDKKLAEARSQSFKKPTPEDRVRSDMEKDFDKRGHDSREKSLQRLEAAGEHPREARDIYNRMVVKKESGDEDFFGKDAWDSKTQESLIKKPSENLSYSEKLSELTDNIKDAFEKHGHAVGQEAMQRLTDLGEAPVVAGNMYAKIATDSSLRKRGEESQAPEAETVEFKGDEGVTKVTPENEPQTFDSKKLGKAVEDLAEGDDDIADLLSMGEDCGEDKK